MRNRLGLGLVLLLSVAGPVSVQQAAPGAVPRADPLLAGFATSTVASVADAVDQIVGRRGYLSHDMRPQVAGAFVGRAATALVRPASPEPSTPALAVKHSSRDEDGPLHQEVPLAAESNRGLQPHLSDGATVRVRRALTHW